MLKFSPCHKGRIELIFVSGPVGVGKTTFSRTLLFSLLSRGYSVCYKSLVSFPLFSYLYFKLTAMLFYGLKIVRMHEKINIHPSTLFMLRVKKIPKPIISILTFLEILSFLLSFYTKIFLSCISKKVIIVDEGIINILASYLEIFGKNTFLPLFLIAFMKKLQHWFNLRIIYLDVKNDEVLLRRWITRKYPLATPIIGIEHHLKYTQLIRCSKTLISKMLQVTEIDNTDNISHKIINEFIERCAQDYQ